MKRFIVLVSRDIPGPMKPTGGGGALQRHVSSSPLISFLHLAPNPPPLILLLPFFFNVRVDLQKEKQRKKARERKRGRKRKCIEMSYNKSKQLPVNFRHASRSSNATPQPGTIRGSTISDLWSFPDSLSLPFATNNETLTWNFRTVLLWTIAYTNAGKLKLSWNKNSNRSTYRKMCTNDEYGGNGFVKKDSKKNLRRKFTISRLFRFPPSFLHQVYRTN